MLAEEVFLEGGKQDMASFWVSANKTSWWGTGFACKGFGSGGGLQGCPTKRKLCHAMAGVFGL